jgi:hypothetical protein
MNEPDKTKALAEFSLKELERRMKLFQTVRKDIRRNVWIGLILGTGLPVAMWIGGEYFRANYAIQLLLYLIPLIAATGAAARVTTQESTR